MALQAHKFNLLKGSVANAAHALDARFWTNSNKLPCFLAEGGGGGGGGGGAFRGYQEPTRDK